jgi:hypothetical protein
MPILAIDPRLLQEVGDLRVLTRNQLELIDAIANNSHRTDAIDILKSHCRVRQ